MDALDAPTWTAEMLLCYAVGLDEVARGKPWKLPELVNPEHTAKLVSAVRALVAQRPCGCGGLPTRLVVRVEPPPPPVGRREPPRAVAVNPVNHWIDTVVGLLEISPMTCSELAEAVGEDRDNVYAKLKYHAGKGKIVTVGRLRNKSLQNATVYGLPGRTYTREDYEPV